MRIFPLLLVSACVTAAFAEEKLHPAVVRIRQLSDGATGSATLICRYKTQGVWLTAAHVVQRGQRIEIDPPNHHGTKRYRGWVVGHDRRIDCALVVSNGEMPKSLQPMAIWVDSAQKAKSVWNEGYSGARGAGRTKGVLTQRNLGTTAEWTTRAIPGDSGGCVLTVHNKKPYLVGVISASDWGSYGPGHATRTYGAHANYVRAFIKNTKWVAKCPSGKYPAELDIDEHGHTLLSINDTQMSCPQCVPEQPGTYGVNPYRQQQAPYEIPVYEDYDDGAGVPAPIPDQSIQKPDLSELNAAVESIQAEIADIRSQLPGPQGDQGPPGPPGEPGPPGPVAEVDYDLIVSRVLAEVRPMQDNLADLRGLIESFRASVDEVRRDLDEATFRVRVGDQIGEVHARGGLLQLTP